MIKASELDKVFTTFKKNYILVPLEVFGNDPYKTIISTLMSSRTKDEVTLEASKRLFVKAPTLEKLDHLTIDNIEKLIYPVGFYKTKAKNIKKLTRVVLAGFEGKIPNSQEKLLTLPGVGVKTANLVMNRAFGKPAIAVDTHVHRITNMLGWVQTKKPEETLKVLEKKVPQKYWSDMNRLFVSIGRQYTTHKKLRAFLKKEMLIK